MKKIWIVEEIESEEIIFACRKKPSKSFLVKVLGYGTDIDVLKLIYVYEVELR